MSGILVVEDTLDILEALQSSLELEGYQVFVATRAAQAIALATSQRPDLIVLDLGLPDRDGYHVLQSVRERRLECPVLILSARNLETDKLEGFRLGADDYVTKPFSLMELHARIGALLRRARPTVQQTAARPLTDDELRERFGLTARQIAVTRLLSEGCSNAEIAKRLSVSYYTARNHTEQILLKLGVASRAAVGALLYGREQP